MPLIPIPSDIPLVVFSKVKIGSLFQFDYNYQLGYPTIHKKTGKTSVQNFYPPEDHQYEMEPDDLCIIITQEEFEKMQQKVD